jgi:hypothetical protein
MKTIRQFVINNLSKIDKYIKLNKIEIKGTQVKSFNIESDEIDNELVKYINKKAVWENELARKYIFSNEELKKYDWFSLCITNRRYYPQPENNFQKYIFNSNLCEKCFIDKKQIYDIEINHYRTLEKCDLYAPYWLDGIIFINKRRINLAESFTGINIRKIIDYKTKAESHLFSQLEITNIIDCELNKNHIQEYFTCPKCNRTKPVMKISPKYKYKIMDKSRLCDFNYSSEIFGVNQVSARDIIISKKVYNMLKAERFNGFRIDPVEFE